MPLVDIDLGDQTDNTFIDDNPANWNGKSIRGQFYQQWGDDEPNGKHKMRDVFPPTAVNVSLYGGFDNCVIPPGYTIIKGTNRRIRVQNDFNDWILDSNGNPVEPMNKARLLKDGKSIDPKDIPATNNSGRPLFTDKRGVGHGL